MLSTTSVEAATSRAVPSQTRPRPMSGRAFAAVRFVADTGWPASSRRPAMRLPIAPRPMNPIRVLAAVARVPRGSSVGWDMVGAPQVDGCGRRGDARLDVGLTEGPGDGDPVASVDDVVAVGTLDDGDRRQRAAATMRERDALPALGDAVGGRPEAGVEDRRRVDRSDDRPQRDHAQVAARPGEGL